MMTLELPRLRLVNGFPTLALILQSGVHIAHALCVAPESWALNIY